jgi:hypothetical protein
LNIRAVGERQALWLITAVGAIGRLAALGQPMRYDESVTWAYFVGRSWSTVVSAYQFPNNHVFFSLLAKATSALAPSQPWALRLPAFVAGVAIVPLTWAVGRRFASPGVGLLGAALAAGSTSLALYSTNARGYSLIVAIFLVLLLLADRLRTSRRFRDWAAFAVLGALGLYTIPAMLYPLGVVSTWLLLAAARARGDERRSLARRVVGASAAAVLIAGALYLPIVRSSGLAALTGNRFVSASTWPVFAGGLPRHALETLLVWTSPLPWWCAPLLIAALLIAALLGARRTERSDRPSLAAATLLWCAVLLAATHRVPFVRVWLFLLPLFHLAVARGALRVAERVRPAAQWSGWPVLSAGSAVALVALMVAGDAVRASDDTGTFPAAREVTALLAGELRPGDRVLAPIPTNGPLLYYFGAAGLDTALLNTPPAQTRRAFLVLDPSRGRSLSWAVSVGMIDPALFHDPAPLLRREDVELWRTERRE